MQTTQLLDKLLEIERSVGHADAIAVRAMLLEAQTQLVLLERDLLIVLNEVHELRKRHRPVVERPAPAAASHALAS